MCKVFAMSNMEKVKITKKFLTAVRNEVCRTGDKHGFGYAVLDESGGIGGERTMRPMDWSPMQPDPKSTKTGSLSCVIRSRDRFGKANFDSPKSFIGHGRYSTNDVALENTHPFYNGDIALIHNGVVRDPDFAIPPHMLKTTNDTEIILRCWEQGGMPKVEQTVSGYYALAVLDKAGLLHIVRDDIAPLYMAYSRTVDSYIFATTKDIIKSVAKSMSWHVEVAEEILENVHVTFDRNEIIKQDDIMPRIDKRTMGAKEYAAFGTGSSRSYTGSVTEYENFPESTEAGSIVDATKKSLAVTPENEPEPSYRETARSKEPQPYATAVEDGELDRKFIDDGAPQTRFPNVPNMSPSSMSESMLDNTSGIDTYESMYSDLLDRKTS